MGPSPKRQVAVWQTSRRRGHRRDAGSAEWLEEERLSQCYGTQPSLMWKRCVVAHRDIRLYLRQQKRS